MEHPETDSYMYNAEGDDPDMAKLTASLTRKFSVELTDGQWETAEASFSFEESYGITSKSDEEVQNYGTALRAFVKAQVDAEMKRQKNEVLRDPVESFVEEVGATVAVVAQHGSSSGPKLPPEEQPPLPSEAAPLPEAKHIADTDYRKTFRIKTFEVAQTATGDKYLQCYGNAPWKRQWVPAWSDVAELLFGDINDMDLGVVLPPYTLDAVVQMKDDEYKGKKFIAPDKVTEWERVEA